MCALKLLKMSKEVLLKKDRGLGRHTFSPETAIPTLSIHPLFWQWTTTSAGRFFLVIVFHLKMTTGFSFFPHSEHMTTTVKPVFWWPVGDTVMLSAPGWINSCGIRRMKGHGHFIHVENTISQWMLSSSFLHETNWRKVVTFSSQSLGSLWPTVVLEHTESLLISLHESSSCLITNVLHFWAPTSGTERTVTTRLALFPWALIVCL